MEMKIGLAIGLALAVAGCQTAQPPPIPQFKTQCERVVFILTSPYTSQTTKMVAMEMGRNHQCFGQAPEQRVKIDQTVTVRP